MMENFSKLISDMKPQVQEAQRTSRRANAQNKTKQTTQKKTIPCHKIFKLQKFKDKKILKEAGGNKYFIYKK